MGFSSWFKKKGFGAVLADYGKLPSDLHGWQVSVELRQIPGKQPYLQLKWELGGENRLWTSLACTPEVFARVETIMRECRSQVEGFSAQRNAAPTGGSATSLGNSDVTEGPPSVS